MRGTEEERTEDTTATANSPTSASIDREEAVIRSLLDTYPGGIRDFQKLAKGVLRARIGRRDLLNVCKHLRDVLSFEHISMISAVEYDDRFEMVYHISSYRDSLLLELVTTTPREDPTVDSVSSIWGGANWQEREAFDLMGIKFNNHPRLERILLPKDYLYHPLRKEFKG